jgi:protein-tyrosine-phosphatase
MIERNEYGTLQSYVEERVTEFKLVKDNRKKELDLLAMDIHNVLGRGNQADIIFICTHNSRRSHMAQLWAQFAAHYSGLKSVITFSGGTEATSINLSAVKAMLDAGFVIKTQIPGSNPIYRASFPGAGDNNRVFSKKYTDPPNPTRNFIAVMTCSDADDACPIVIGAAARHTIKYEDPKVFDGTPGEAEGYAERSRQISREMLYLFSRVAAIK